jgi:hypothetical protein
MRARALIRRLDRLAPKAQPVFVWVKADDAQDEIAAKIRHLPAAERRNVQFIGWQDAADAMQWAIAMIEAGRT